MVLQGGVDVHPKLVLKTLILSREKLTREELLAVYGVPSH